MLQSIRDRAQGIIVWTIVGLIIITFALFGLSSYLSGTAKSVVATVNGVEISETDLLREYQNAQQRLQQMLGENYRADLFNEQIMKQQVLEGLIQREVINQYLEDENYHVAPQQVVATLHRMPAFQDANGQFSEENYRKVLSLQGIPAELFEMQLARDIENEHLRNGVVRTTFATEGESKRYHGLQDQQRKIGYLRIPQQQYVDQIQVSDDEIAAYYQQHQQEFSTPEEVAVDYVELNLANIASQIDVSDAEVREYYDQHKDNYVSQQAQRKVRHILVKVDADNDEQTARKKIESIATRIKNGEDFATIAKAESQDPGSASQGGDLGFISPGVMDKAFEQAVFQLKLHELSQPVRTRFGYHLIEVTQIRPQELKPFDEVKAQIRKDLQVQQAEQRFYEEVDTLNNLSYEIPDSLVPVAEKLGLEVKKSSYFTKAGGEGLFSNDRVVNAAFSEDVLNLNRNSDLIELSDTHVMVLHLRDHKAAAQRPLDEVRQMIVGRIKQQQARELAAKDAKAALDRLAGSETPEKVAKEYQQKWQEPGFIKRQSSETDKINEQIREAAFALPHPKNDQPKLTSLMLSGGDSVVLALYAVQDGGPVTDTKALQADKQQLANMSGQIEYSAFLAYLTSQADITRNLNPTEE
jgi:peptidyl-prolyl cis-trans isomerase D